MSPSEPDLVTVVIPTYNRSAGLRKAVASVTDQNVPRVGIHIYDNASTDDTPAVVEELIRAHPSIRYTRRETNLGSLLNYSGAMRAVDTPYLMSLADDDWLLEGSIATLLGSIQRNPTLGAAIATTLHVTPDGNIFHRNPTAAWEAGVYDSDRLFSNWLDIGHIEWSSAIFRMDVLKELDLPDISADAYWDVDLQLRIFSRYGAEIIHHDAAVFLCHPGQDHRQPRLSKYEGGVRMLGRAAAIYQNRDAAQRVLLEKFFRRWIDLMGYEVAQGFGFRTFNTLLRDLQKTGIPAAFATQFLTRYLSQRLRVMARPLKRKLGR